MRKEDVWRFAECRWSDGVDEGVADYGDEMGGVLMETRLIGGPPDGGMWLMPPSRA